MKFYGKLLSGIAVLSFLFAGVVLAGETKETKKNISLSEAVKIAYTNNFNLQAARAQLEASRKDKDIARSYFFPRLDVEQTLVKSDQQVSAFGLKLNHGSISQMDFNPALLNDPDEITDYGTKVTVSQPIFNGGQEILGYKLSNQGIEIAEADTRAAEEAVLYETVKAYLGTMLAREGLKVATEALATAEKNLEMIQHQYEQGMVIKSDLLQAKVHVAQVREKKVNAENNLKLALVGLNTILGSPGGNYYPSLKLEGGSCPPVDLPTLKKWALADRPELRSLDAKVRAAELQVKMAQAPYLPNLNAMGSYEYHGENFLSDGADSVTLALSLKLNLFNGTADYYKVRKAKNQLLAVQRMRAGQRDMVLFEVEQAYYNLQTAIQRLEVTSESVEQAKESLSIIEQRYKEGAAGIVDLLRTELALTSARFDRLQANHDVLLENAYLCKAVGHLYTRWLEPENCPIPDPVPLDEMKTK